MSAREGRWKLHRTAPRARERGNKDDVWIDNRGPDGHTIIAPFEQSEPWEYPSPPDTRQTAPSKKMQLFDLQADPYEQTDVTSQHPEVVARLQDLMETELATVEEVAPVNPSNVQYNLGPGRIVEDNPVPIEEALKKTFGAP